MLWIPPIPTAIDRLAATRRVLLSDAAWLIKRHAITVLPSVASRSALLHSSDTLLAFALRAVEHAVADQSQTDREIMTRLWDVLEDPHLNQALGMTQNSRFMLGPNSKRR